MIGLKRGSVALKYQQVERDISAQKVNFVFKPHLGKDPVDIHHV